MVNITSNLNPSDQQARQEWERAGVSLPQFDIPGMKAASASQPRWIHFGAGNLFRAVHAPIAQSLLDQGLTDSGILVAETFDPDIIRQAYQPYDDRFLQVVLHADGSMSSKLIASVVDSFPVEGQGSDWDRLASVFRQPSLQMVTATITEKGYALLDAHQQPLPWITAEFEGGPSAASSAIGVITAMLLARYQAGAYPLAMVSTDNFSRNGERFEESVLLMAQRWQAGGFVDQGFLDYLQDSSKISFPLTMIDRITPNPAQSVAQNLSDKGVEGMELIRTAKGTAMATFANTEETWYWVVEDNFPGGRPPLEQAGVYLADRDTVNAADEMKVTGCLNPLHTALAVFGMLLGYPTMSQTIGQPDLKALVSRLGYDEDLPVVPDPKIFSPREFLRQVIEVRVPNPNMPDTPARISADTSQKMPIRFGRTIAKYMASSDLQLDSLKAIPLIIAAWLRLLVGRDGQGTDDSGQSIQLSPDPRMGDLQAILGQVTLGPSAVSAQEAQSILQPILADESIFGNDLNQTVLAGEIAELFAACCQGQGAVAATLHEQVAHF
ncbi:mannitol dehydrogenase [Bombiscardovia nodaiensis]|uniref:Mannitol dehydrogenase n=1 Tax=Bombiscardovia nodaiensis TaxID=2932181 RepID=A0ABM8B6D7_9BIFI|nr:mannitol dehydrogenase [Bombiscardovia nodaiensis]